jgi:hypothetical protein
MSHLNRTIHINNAEWKYRIGRINVLIQDPRSGKKHTIPFKDLAPAKWEQAYEHYCCYFCDGPRNLSITPADVRDYIEKNF